MSSRRAIWRSWSSRRQGTACTIDINTAAHGFAPIWQAVVTDFFERHRIGGLRISINDAGATPAIVSLRLDQAIDEYTGTKRDH